MEHDLRSLVAEVLDKGYLLSLATADENGPWVADLIYVHDEDLNVYWMSDPDVRHSKALADNPQVAGAITASGSGDSNLGIQFFGTAEKIEGERHDLAVKLYTKRKLPEPKEGDDVLLGDSWYVVRPKKIDLHHEKMFGYEKRIIEL